MFLSSAILSIALLAVPTPGQAQTIDAETRQQILVPDNAPPERSRPTCRNLPAVEVLAGETYHGTEGDDVIHVSGADAWVYGHGGNDLICAWSDNDSGSRIYGGDGDDIVISLGSHLVFGEAGDDVLLLNGGFNEAWGGPGDDIINGAGATQLLGYGEGGNDIINGSPGADWLGGYDGNDLIMGWGGDDLIYGMDGDDDLRGGNGFDEIGASNGQDHCVDFAGPVNGANITDCEDVVVTLGGGIGGLKG
jgi:Ca2+-binding RTX toxin-like protein